MKRLKLDIQRFASGTISFTTDGPMTGKIEWSSTVQGSTPAEKASLNKSSVTAIVYVRRTYSWTQGDFTGNININGNVTNYTSPIVYVETNWVEVARKTIDVPHNADGSKTITISGVINGPTGTSLEGRTVTGSVSCVLDRIARYTTVSTWSVASKTETSITLNWKTADTCSQIRYGKAQNDYTTANVNGNSGTVTISGLQAGQPYTLYFMPKRKDSGLWGNGSDDTWKSLANQSTYNYPELKSKSNFIIGNQLAMAIDNPLNRQMTISILGDDNSTIRTFSNTVGSYVITFTSSENDALYRSIPNKQKANYKVRVQTTVSDKTTTGGTYEINQDNCRPTFNNFTYADTNTTTTALTGNNQIVVQNYSNVQATVSTSNKAVANNSASMVRYNLVIGNSSNSVNYSDNEDVSATINNVSSNIINLYAEDSRGLTTLVTKTATLKAYTTIQKNEIKVERAGNVGTGVTLTYDGTLWGQSFGSVTNTAKSARYRFKKTNEDWPQTWNGTTTITPTTNGNNYSFTGGIAGDLGNTGFSAEYSFNIEVEVFDELSSIVFSFVLGTGIPHIAVADDGIAIKQPYDDNLGGALQVNGKTNLKGNTTITGDESVSGKITATGNIEAGGKLKGNSFARNTTDTWVPVLNGGYLDYTLRDIWTTKTHSGYNTNQDYLVTKSCLSWWNGAYNGSNASNLTYAHQGTIQCKPTTLYSNDNGTNGTVTLSQTSANFTFLDISYRTNDGTNYVGTARVIRYLSSANYNLVFVHINGTNSWLKSKLVTISGTTITTTQNIEYQLATNGTSASNVLYITRVIGWK